MELYPIRKQLLIAVVLYLGQLLTGYMFGWSAPIIPKLQDIDQSPLPNVINDQEAAWIGSFIYIGAITGPYVTGFLSKRKGRKPSFLLAGSIKALSYFVLALSSNLAMIYTGRILGGLGAGIIFVTNLVYIGEMSSTHTRGILLTCTGVSGSVGTLLTYSIAPFISYAGTAYFGLALSVVYIIGLFFIPETPLYLALKGEDERAKEVLVYLGREQDVEKVISAKEDGITEQISKKQWSEIISIKSNRKAFFITLTLNTLQQFSGIIAVIMFTTTIFDLAGSSIAPELATIVIGITQLSASTIAPLFVERLGRKTLLLVSIAFCCLSLTILGVYFYLDHIGNSAVMNLGWLPLVALIIFMLCYGLGFGIIPNMFIGEMFTPNVSRTGSTVTITVAWLVGFFLSSAFAAMIARGTFVPFFMYAASCAVAFIFTLIFVPETKGKTLIEIQDMLSR